MKIMLTLAIVLSLSCTPPLIAQDLWGHLNNNTSPVRIEKVATYGPDDSLQWYGVIRPNGKGNDLNLYMFDSRNKLNSFSVVERDRLGRAKKIRNYDSDRELINYMVIRYDFANQLKSRTFFDRHNRLRLTILYQYNRHGNLFRTEWSYKNKRIFRYGESEYSNGIDGEPVKTTWYHPNGDLSAVFEYTYDDKGKLLRKNMFKSDGSLWNYYIYEY